MALVSPPSRHRVSRRVPAAEAKSREHWRTQNPAGPSATSPTEPAPAASPHTSSTTAKRTTSSQPLSSTQLGSENWTTGPVPDTPTIGAPDTDGDPCGKPTCHRTTVGWHMDITACLGVRVRRVLLATSPAITGDWSTIAGPTLFTTSRSEDVALRASGPTPPNGTTSPRSATTSSPASPRPNAKDGSAKSKDCTSALPERRRSSSNSTGAHPSSSISAFPPGGHHPHDGRPRPGQILVPLCGKMHART